MSNLDAFSGEYSAGLDCFLAGGPVPAAVGFAAAMAVPGTKAAQIPIKIAAAIAGARRLPML